MDYSWTCQCCGKQYGSLPFGYALDEPDPWRAVPEAERGRRGELTSDACVIDGKEYYIRGRVVIPVIGRTESFIWGTWASVSKESFERIERLWDVEFRDREGPFFGWFASDLPIYPRTFKLKCSVHLKNRGTRPSIMLEPMDHPLAVEQRDGITLDRVKEIASKVLQHSK